MAFRDGTSVQRVPKLEIFDAKCKVIVVGNSGVGKTSFIKRVVERVFHSQHMVTIAGDYSELYYIVNKTKLKVELWDTCGLEQYRAINNIYFKGADLALVFFDCTNTSSLYDCTDWIREVREHTLPSVLIHLVGAKTDHPNQLTSYEVARSFAKQQRLSGVHLVSAKTGDKVDATMQAVVAELAEINTVKEPSEFGSRLIRGSSVSKYAHSPSCAC